MSKKRKNIKINRIRITSIITNLFDNNFKYIVFLVFVFFLLQILYFVFKTGFGVSPDEIFHFEQILVFRDNWNFVIPPLESGIKAIVNAYSAGSLYHVFFGKLISIFRFDDTSLTTFLRLCNVGFALIYFVYFFRLCKLVLEKKVLVFFALLIHSSILMFVFLYGNISYDNLINCLSICSLYYIFDFIKSTDKYRSLLLAMIFSLIGCLVKLTFFPLLAIYFSIVIIIIFKDGLLNTSKKIVDYVKTINLIDKILIALFVFIFLFNIYVRINTYMKFGTVMPGCEVIYNEKKCITEDVQYRTYYNLHEVQKKSGKQLLNVYDYFNEWKLIMIERTFSIFGHKSYVLDPTLKNDINIVLTLFSILVAFNILFRRNKIGKLIWASIYIFISYALVLFFYVNYRNYLGNGIVSAAVQGRYLFPVISLFIISFVYFIRYSFGYKISLIILTLLAIQLMYMSFPMYLQSESRERVESNI